VSFFGLTRGAETLEAGVVAFGGEVAVGVAVVNAGGGRGKGGFLGAEDEDLAAPDFVVRPAGVAASLVLKTWALK